MTLTFEAKVLCPNCKAKAVPPTNRVAFNSGKVIIFFSTPKVVGRMVCVNISLNHSDEKMLL
jgi:hypothetical protein